MSMVTFCKVCLSQKGTKKWTPNSIFTYENIFEKLINQHCNIKTPKNIRKNICYQMQYLEFINELLSKSNFTSVIETQNYKSFTIFAGSVVEALLYCLINKHNRQSLKKYEEIEKIISNEYNPNVITNDKIRVTTTVEKKLSSPENALMNFDTLIKIAKSNKLLGTKFNYAELTTIRNFRNKVHIHVIEENRQFSDTDYYNFNNKNYNQIKKCLYDVIESATGANTTEMASFSWLI